LIATVAIAVVALQFAARASIAIGVGNVTNLVLGEPPPAEEGAEEELLVETTQTVEERGLGGFVRQTSIQTESEGSSSVDDLRIIPLPGLSGDSGER
jgi:hypothetical protein